MRVGPRTPTTPTARPGSPVRGEDERDVAHLLRRVLRADEDLDGADAGHPVEELAEVGPVLEHREDPPELVAPLELGRLHHVEQAVAEDLLDHRRVIVADRGDHALADPPDERPDRPVASRSGRAPAPRRRRSGPAITPSRITATRVRSSCSAGSASATRTCRRAPSRKTMIRLASRSVIDDEVDPADVGGAGLGGRREPGDAVGAREGRRREAEPLLRRVLHLAELVADHQLLDRRELARRPRSTRRSSGSRHRSGCGPRSCGDGSGDPRPRGRRGCSGRSRSTRRGRSGRRAPGSRPGSRSRRIPR